MPELQFGLWSPAEELGQLSQPLGDHLSRFVLRLGGSHLVAKACKVRSHDQPPRTPTSARTLLLPAFMGFVFTETLEGLCVASTVRLLAKSHPDVSDFFFFFAEF